MGSSKKSQVIGHEYGARMHLGLGLAADEIYRIDIGGKTAWIGSIKKNGSIFINKPNLFGGKKGEGGVVGSVSMLFGAADQPQHSTLVRYLGKLIPAFRGTVTMVFDGILCAMNWYPKAWDICYRRLMAGWPDDTPWYPEKISIMLADGKIQAMNPAHILYESYISNTWGASVPRSNMDEEAYKKAADTLYAENFGLCFEWKATDSLKNLRTLVCEHIGATVGTDPATGKNTIILIRDDYKLEDLPIFDEDTGLLEIKFEATNNTEVPSQIIAKYTDAITFEERPAYANNPAIAQGQRGRNTETIEFPAIPTGELATRVAYRELKAKTSGIKRCTVKLDRRAYAIVVGQPFRIKTKYRINNFDIVVRADRRQEQFLTDGTITLNAIQDIFSLPKLSFNIVPPAPEPQPPQPPVPVTNSLLFEVTYRELAALLDPANLQLLDDSASFIAVLAVSPSDNCYSYDLLTRVRGAATFTEPNDTGTWCPVATIASNIGFTDKVIHITDSELLDTVEVGTAALIDGEIVRIDTIDLDNNQLTVGRGCIDTVPAEHKTGATIWFYDSSETTDAIEYNPGTIVETKLLPNTFTERLDPSQASTQTITIQGRQACPYPPGNVRINGLVYPTTVDDYLTVTWATRNRLLQADKLIDTTVGDIAAEDNTTYNLNFIIDGAIAHKVTGLTNKAYTWNTEIGAMDYVLMQFENNLDDEAGNSWTPTGTPVYTDGIVQNSAIRFNSTNGLEYLFLPSNANLNFGTDIDFTIDFWVKWDSRTNNFGTILCNYFTNWSTAADARFIMLYGSAATTPEYRNRLSFGAKALAPGNNVLLSVGAFPINTWAHVAITRQGSLYSMFINGVLNVQNVLEGAAFNFGNTGTVLGRNHWDSANQGKFQGCLDQLRISRGCLFSSDFTPSTEPYTYNPGTTLNKAVTVELEAVRDGLSSWQKHKITIQRS